MKAKLSTLLMVMVLISMAFVPVTSAQPDEHSKVKYNVSKDKALEHAQAHMVDLVATNTQKVENWKEATISNDPLELYDINDKKLYYLFSVYNDTSMVGRIKVAANKTLGHSVKTFNFDPKPIEADRAKDKSIAIANKKYPKGDIKSTKMVVYSYHKIGSMTLITDKSTGDKHRIFVDAYTLDVISDKTPTKTESEVWSTYGQIPKEDVVKNVNKWYDSNNLTKTIKQEFDTRGIDISKPISTNNLKESICHIIRFNRT
ncbi:hypothetical protein [Methanohalobium sp.]|uniref:hypothetical protein n=1 Tax=Methanohalobium sp. TaxID=2837493 RepID=UPI0025F67E5C|nr:hypothetical protein [Methanohalobium sp.]